MATIPAPTVAIPANAAEFRLAAPSFSNTGMFPDDSIVFWMNVATIMLNAARWGSMLGLAVILFTEHNLALEAMAQVQVNNGGIPGMAKGVLSAESVKSVSASYDTGLAGVEGAGHWNLTTFGTRLIWLINMFGAGPIQCNIGPGGTGGAFAAYSAALFDVPCGPGWRG